MIGAIEIRRSAKQSVPGIVDEVFDLSAFGGKRRSDPIARIGLTEVAGNDNRKRSTRRDDLGRKRIEAVGAARHQRQPVVVGGEDTCQFGADPGGGTCYQRHQMSHDSSS